MSQHDHVIDDAHGAAFLADLNAELAATVSLNSGASAPATTYPYMLWADTTSGWLKQRNAADSAWILRAPLGTGAAVDIASAGTLDLTSNSASSGTLRITGTTATTGITLADGQTRLLRAAGAWPITHGSSLLCPGSASYTCAAGDLILAIGEATGVVRLMIWPADGLPAVAPAFKLGSFTRDLSLASGSVAYTGVGFQPRLVEFFGGISGTGYASVNGHDDGSAAACLYQNGSGLFTPISSSSIVFRDAGSNLQEAHVSAFGADGFTLAWTKTGSPTGTATIFYRAYP